MLKFWNRDNTGRSTTSPQSSALKPQLSLFAGIGERDVVALYNAATIKQLNASATLYRENDLADAVFVVLTGLIRTRQQVNARQLEGQLYGEGDWIAGADFDHPAYRVDAASAAEPSTVMVIKKATLIALDEPLKSYVYGKIQAASVQALSNRNKQLLSLVGESEQLKKELIRVRSRGKTDFVKSDAIRGVINKIPKLPVSTVNIVNKLHYEEVSTLEMVELVRSDPALTGLLLKTINSSYYNFRQKIADVNHAVGLFGFDSVYQIIMAESIRQSLPDTPEFKQVYQHSLQVSHIAFAVSQASQVGRPSELSTLGLVHEIGHIVLELMKKQNPKLAGLIDLIDSAEVAAELLGTWNLPDRICSSIRYQHHPEYSQPATLPGDVRDNTAILYIAHLCYELLHKRPQQELPTLFLHDYLAVLNWQRLSLREVLNSQIIPALQKRADVLPQELVAVLPG
ncbi:MAG: HDOD domain-containing protein [Halopseudomonas sp.]